MLGPLGWEVNEVGKGGSGLALVVATEGRDEAWVYPPERCFLKAIVEIGFVTDSKQTGF
jgi:hypothetical protein